MGYKPPKGIAPPQLEGKRTGRPRGSRNHAAEVQDILWAYEHRDDENVSPPNSQALWWWRLGLMFPDELEMFLEDWEWL